MANFSLKDFLSRAELQREETTAILTDNFPEMQHRTTVVELNSQGDD